MNEEKPKRVKATNYPYNLVEVLWHDAETTNGWEDEHENDPIVPLCLTVGFLIKENEKLVCIASTTGDDRTHNSRIIIPRGMIQNVKVIKKATRKKQGDMMLDFVEAIAWGIWWYLGYIWFWEPIMTRNDKKRKQYV